MEFDPDILRAVGADDSNVDQLIGLDEAARILAPHGDDVAANRRAIYRLVRSRRLSATLGAGRPYTSRRWIAEFLQRDYRPAWAF